MKTTITASVSTMLVLAATSCLGQTPLILDDTSIPHLVYDSAQGSGAIDYSGFSLTGLTIESVSQSLLPDVDQPGAEFVVSRPDKYGSVCIFECDELTNISGRFEFGPMLPTGWDATHLLDDLTAEATIAGGGTTPLGLVVVPEPSTLNLTFVAMLVAGNARRRKRDKNARVSVIKPALETLEAREMFCDAGEIGTITNISPAFPSFRGGQPTTINVEVQNRGDADDMLIEAIVPFDWESSPSHYNPHLDNGQTYRASFNITPPAEGGSATLEFAFLDDDFFDNCELDSRTLFVNADPGPRPDLTVQSVSVSQPVVAGQQFTVTATTLNQGQTDADSFSIGYTFDGIQFDTDSVFFGLDASRTDEETATHTTSTPGNHELCVTADISGQVNEENENNNRTCVTVTVAEPPRPDIVVDSIDVSPAVAGHPTTVTVVTRNQGAARAGAFDIAYFLGGSEIGRDRLSLGLRVGDTDPESIDVVIEEPGPHSVSVRVDVSGELDEGPDGESNNLSQPHTFDVGFIDVGIQDVFTDPLEPHHGQPYTLKALVVNHGTVTADAGFLRSQEVSFEVDGAPVGNSRFDNLLPGESRTVELLLPDAPGRNTHTVGASIDTNGVKDLDPSNDQLITGFATILPDIHSAAVHNVANSFYRDQPIPDGDLWSIDIGNVGDIIVGPGVQVDLFLGDAAGNDKQIVELGSASHLGQLQPHSSTTVDFSGNDARVSNDLSPGDFRVWALARYVSPDGADRDEISVENNWGSSEVVTVLPDRPDLAIVESVDVRESYRTREEVSSTVILENRGTAPVFRRFNVAAHLVPAFPEACTSESVASAIASTQVEVPISRLEPGQQHQQDLSIQVPEDAQQSYYALCVQLDPGPEDGLVKEENSVQDPAMNNWRKSRFFFVHAKSADFNQDSRLDSNDIDTMFAQVRSSTFDTQFDLNSDDTVDQDDVNILVRDILGTDIGDANLDRQIDSTDIQQVVQSNKFETGESAGWAEGDWDGDGDFDFDDVWLLLQSGPLG